MDETLIYGIFGLLGFYLFIRWLISKRQSTTTTPIDLEITQILEGEEHQVKGRYD